MGTAFETIERDWDWSGHFAPTYDAAHPGRGYAPRMDNCHDDGPRNLFGLGGIGTGTFGRDLDGRFSRWHLQNGYHRRFPVDAAQMWIRWRQGDRTESYRLAHDANAGALPAEVRSVRPLFPIVRERVASADWPAEVFLESFSPVIPGDYAASSLPVAFFDVHVRNRSDEPLEFDTAFFWPNPLGWRPGIGGASGEGASLLLYEDAEKAALKQPAWDDLCNAGNICRPVEADAIGAGDFLGGIRYANTLRQRPVADQQGEWLLGACGEGARFSRATSFSCFGPNEGQGWTAWMMPEAVAAFRESGTLPDRGLSWPAMSFEVLGGAVSAGRTLGPGESCRLGFFLVWDTPLVAFESGRVWRKQYTDTFGCSGAAAADIAAHALPRREDYRERIGAWHRSVAGGGNRLPEEPQLAGALLNELYFTVDGGTVWTAGEHSADGLPEARLGDGEHFSILEGYDIGYFYYSTFDLYPHAMALVEGCWPRLGDLLFRDFFRSIPQTIRDERPFYQDGSTGRILEAGRIPHDIGSPPGDPWHALNDYQYRVNANLWKDHNPAFLVSHAYHRYLAGGATSAEDWERMLALAESMEAVDRDGDGLPEHDSPGDSTWDALDEEGPVLYSAALTLGAWAALADEARRLGDGDNAARFEDRLRTATEAFETAFWNGSHYRNATRGERADWVAADGLFGILVARRAGLGELLPTERVRAHLQAVYRANFLSNGDGTHGPTLLAPPDGWGDASGGTQVGEVLVGSSWSCVAQMVDAGLRDEARAVARTLVDVLYHRSGLQFRTPAAWTKDGTFRAALNFRPMAIGYLLGESENNTNP